ncbi:fibroblast growth factor 1-like [Actinia tenebrosa]|uniref:Fibroblast growth factor 1-like n=1 Tax=Actinia tenebrosa TaxID=6105 RepID=A0A6P8I8X8_ACTTE|nr:fibroblast growth factor 1-like [Actinia tenebrosa]
MVGASPIFSSILLLVSLAKTPKPTKRNITCTATPRLKRANYTSTALRPTFNVLSGIVQRASFRRQAKLVSKTGFHLVMLPSGMLKGSVKPSTIDKYGVFELQSYGPSVIRIKSVAHQRFIAIDQNGKVYSTENATVSTVLLETQRLNSFHSFSSYMYHGKGMHKNWYLAIKRNGHMKNAGKVLRHHKSYQFQVLHKTKKGKPHKDTFWLPGQNRLKG